MKKDIIKNWSILAGLIIVFIIIISNMNWWESALRFLFPNESTVIYQRVSLTNMIIQHLKIVAISSSLTIITGVPLGIMVTRPAGKDFREVTNNLISIGQTFPPVAVLALAVPVFGFGLVPTIIALFLYGLLPVVRNTIAGLKSVPEHILDSAYGLGMSRLQALFRIELPLSLKVIIAGIRISVIINIGTAMIGSVIGAGGLGSPIIAGLVQDNIAYIIEGVVPAAFLAIIADRFFSNFENLFIYGSDINQN
jgi:osmoprotectant transport system permease protein